MQNVPKDLGRRISEAAALAVRLHLEANGGFGGTDAPWGGTLIAPDGTETQAGGAGAMEARAEIRAEDMPLPRLTPWCCAEWRCAESEAA